ncbi:MAG: glycerophosphodiester phosphodiesterase [Gemmatimonadaceae bacterium]
MPQLIGHRGTPRERPENTLSAFLRALDHGANGIELDVHATRDGVVVVHHDPVLHGSARTDGRELRDLDYAEVATHDLGGGVHVPRLGDVLAAVAGRMDVYVEIKGRDIEAEVMAVVKRSAAPARCAVHSFDHRAVQRALTLAPGTRGGILLSSYLIDTVAALRAAGAADLWQWWELVDRPLVDQVHAAGGRVIAWTVNDVRVARQLATMGVDALCTDDLPPMRDAFASGVE